MKKISDKIIPILEKHGIKRAGLFGSFSRAEETGKSDLDILVELGSKISLLEFVKIKLELEDILKKRVDLVEYQSIKKRLKERILKEEVRIYG